MAASVCTRSRRTRHSRCTISTAVEHATRQIATPSASIVLKHAIRATTWSSFGTIAFSATAVLERYPTNASYKENPLKIRTHFTIQLRPWSRTRSWSIKQVAIISSL